ncbi:DUF2690 domain-containing protein [Streptosporangium sp. NPDC000239]|uniref:DUF2690 domain-containing protein n=1 Tax=unclassified Streptosporangium TaxID=2632669 RepID=UPI00332511AC
MLAGSVAMTSGPAFALDDPSGRRAAGSDAACYANPSEATCDNTDPEVSGCGKDAFTVSQAYLWHHTEGGTPTVQENAVVELRYSPHCGTNWSKVRVFDGAASVQVHLCRDGFNTCTDLYTVYGSTLAFSDQLYARNVTATAYGACCWGNGAGPAWAEVSG